MIIWRRLYQQLGKVIKNILSNFHNIMDNITNNRYYWYLFEKYS